MLSNVEYNRISIFICFAAFVRCKKDFLKFKKKTFPETLKKRLNKLNENVLEKRLKNQKKSSQNLVY